MEQFINQVLNNRYNPQSLLGRQTGRRTFLARDLQTDSSVVVKLLLLDPDFTWENLKLFEREAETLKVLEHPSIPKYLDSFEVDTQSGKGFALVQSYIEAQSIQNWFECGRSFSEAEIEAIAKELLEILIYLHDRQPPVIHRDIKPSNILLANRTGNSPGSVYLVDFGSVQTVAHGGTRTVVGTYGYMPPEQFGGRATPLSDLYSLGATMIYLATGQHPAALLTENLRLDFQEFAQLSPQLTAWLQRMVQSAPSQRFSSAKAALQALNNPEFYESRLNRDERLPISRPKSTKCIITQDERAINILIPAGNEISFGNSRSSIFGGVGCFVFLIIITTLIPPPILAFIWASMTVVILILARFIRNFLERNKIKFHQTLLTIDDKEMSLWEISTKPSGEKKCLRKANFSEIKQIKLVTFVEQYYGTIGPSYGAGSVNGEIVNFKTGARKYYYVEVMTNTSNKRDFALGDRMYYLSLAEAEWLANELSIWLEIPISEVQITEKKFASDFLKKDL